MRLVCFLLFIWLTFAQSELSLASDASNPYGATEAIINMSLEVPLAPYKTVVSRTTKKLRSYHASVDLRSWLGPARQQSATSEEIDVGCGSCVTFATIAAAESAYYKKFGKKAEFSEMELVDCMYQAGGCNGNNVQNAFKHVFNNGVALRKDYPYKPTDLDVCNSKIPRYYKYRFVPYTIESTNWHWKHFLSRYSGAVLSMYYGTFTMNKDNIVIDCKGASSNPKKTNHAVLIAGYGKLNNVEYYLIRNSWGTTARYHDNGYIKIKVGACNTQARNYSGFIYDTCPEHKEKSKCQADATCSWSAGKCKSQFISFKTKVSSALSGIASFFDSIIDKVDGIGLNGLPSKHVLRKNNLIGTEFMCFMKVAGYNRNSKTVENWFQKAVSNGAVDKNTGKILNYSSLRSLLNIKSALTTTIATKSKLNKKYQQMDDYRFHILAGSAKYWDARYNQNENGKVFLILGTCKDGVKTMRKIDWSKK